MKLFAELKRATELLNEYPTQWAICGGVASSIYRSTARYTDDIDFAIIDSEKISARNLASLIIKELGYKEYQGFVPDPQDESKQINALICARDLKEDRFKGLDFLLPVQPWVTQAVALAQENRIDYGFSFLPTITPECLIFAKLIALNSNPERYKDLDDIKEILSANKINLEFIRQEISKSGMVFKPDVLQLVKT